MTHVLGETQNLKARKEEIEDRLKAIQAEERKSDMHRELLRSTGMLDDMLGPLHWEISLQPMDTRPCLPRSRGGNNGIPLQWYCRLKLSALPAYLDGEVYGKSIDRARFQLYFPTPPPEMSIKYPDGLLEYTGHALAVAKTWLPLYGIPGTNTETKVSEKLVTIAWKKEGVESPFRITLDPIAIKRIKESVEAHQKTLVKGKP